MPRHYASLTILSHMTKKYSTFSTIEPIFCALYSTCPFLRQDLSFLPKSICFWAKTTLFAAMRDPTQLLCPQDKNTRGQGAAGSAESMAGSVFGGQGAPVGFYIPSQAGSQRSPATVRIFALSCCVALRRITLCKAPPPVRFIVHWTRSPPALRRGSLGTGGIFKALRLPPSCSQAPLCKGSCQRS